MTELLPTLVAAACTLGMLVMGAGAWFPTKLRRR
jgi:hypothetical protein